MERLLYLSNQTEWYHAVSTTTFYLDPGHIQVTSVQKFTNFSPSTEEYIIFAILSVFGMYYFIVRPIRIVIEDCQYLADEITAHYYTDVMSHEIMVAAKENDI